MPFLHTSLTLTFIAGSDAVIKEKGQQNCYYVCFVEYTAHRKVFQMDIADI
jgi:hypothetical protein